MTGEKIAGDIFQWVVWLFCVAALTCGIVLAALVTFAALGAMLTVVMP